jgi:hypothetical protein
MARMSRQPWLLSYSTYNPVSSRMGSACGGWRMKRNGGRSSGGEMGYLKVMRNGKSINLTVLCSRCAVETRG